jgi:hypothetical protein
VPIRQATLLRVARRSLTASRRIRAVIPQAARPFCQEAPREDDDLLFRFVFCDALCLETHRVSCAMDEAFRLPTCLGGNQSFKRSLPRNKRVAKIATERLGGSAKRVYGSGSGSFALFKSLHRLSTDLHALGQLRAAHAERPTNSGDPPEAWLACSPKRMPRHEKSHRLTKREPLSVCTSGHDAQRWGELGALETLEFDLDCKVQFIYCIYDCQEQLIVVIQFILRLYTAIEVVIAARNMPKVSN